MSLHALNGLALLRASHSSESCAGGLTSPAFHAYSSASPFRAHCCHSNQKQVVSSPLPCPCLQSSGDRLVTPIVTPAMGIKIIYQISCGVMCLHSRSITHRDLNTNNVLVYSLDSDNLNVLVSDFGLSRELEAGVATTMTGV